jgi:hypothetical protein
VTGVQTCALPIWKLSKDDKTTVCGFLDPKRYKKKFGEDGDGLDDQVDRIDRF